MVGLATVLFQTAAPAQGIPALHRSPGHGHGDIPDLHVNPRWRECSFQLHHSLTQDAWHQFTREAGLVVYFRPLADARPMGKGKFEVSGLTVKTGIDDADAAWNDTFVHPDSTHVLFEGSGLQFPGLMVRAGVTDKTDVNLYLTKSVGANYGFYGVQVQQALSGGGGGGWSTAARVSFVSMYGPDDFDFRVIGADLVASREVRLSSWATLSPYALVSGYLANSNEKSSVVDLDDEHVPGAQASVGAALQLSFVRLGVEYNVAQVNSFSLKVGIAF
jgi:hypothetical protein